MIKAEVNVTGRITRNAMIRTDKTGKPYVAFTVAVSLPDAKNVTNEVIIYVSVPNGQQTDLALYTENTRVTINGTLDVKKKDDNLVLYLTANLLSTEGVGDLDTISGELMFRGRLRSEKVFEEKSDKNGNPFLVFTAFSSEKVGENFISTWVNFMRFPEKDAGIDTIKPDWMQPKARVTVKGDFQLESYGGKVRIASRVREMEQYVSQPNTSYQN